MTVLVTGATGFIGAWVARNLHKKGVKFILSDIRFDTSRLKYLMDNPESLPFISLDLRNAADLDKVLKEHDVERIIHLAALQIPQCRADPVNGGLVNVVGFLKIFEAAKKYGGVKNIVYASSIAVYGPQELYGEKPLSEDAPLNPTTHYGAFKVCNELSAYAYWVENNIPSVGLRPHTVYGFGRDVGVTSDVTTALKAAILKKPFKIRFGGKVSMQYAADVAEAFVAAAFANPSGAKVYNIGGPVVSVSEIIDAICKIVPDARELVSYIDSPLPVAYAVDDTAFRRDIKDIAYTSVMDGLRETYEIFQRAKAAGELTLPQQ